MSDHLFSDKPPSRAERLMQAAMTAERAAQGAPGYQNSPATPPPGGKGRPKSGARARALNRRIREVLREQEAEVYSLKAVPGRCEAAGSEGVAVEGLAVEGLAVEGLTAEGVAAQPGGAGNVAVERGYLESPVPQPLPPRAAPHSYDALPNELPPPPPQPEARGASWEDVANEVAPRGLTRPGRGLATGAMRGPALRRPSPSGAVPRELSQHDAPPGVYAPPPGEPLPGEPLPGPARPAPHPVWRARPDQPRAILCDLPAPHEPLALALRGEEQYCEHNGIHLLISREAATYDQAFCGLKERLHSVLRSERLLMLSGCDVEELLFVDIETAGLSSSQPLFLIGALRMDGTPRLNLFLARDYPEEKAALAAFHQIARGKRLVTFNGKSFDWPYIEGRSISYRLRFERPRAHFDLLHHARKTWKHTLPNCKLQTLELYLCGRTRIDDVPGSQIPAAYHEFVATHAATGCGAHLMAPILHHNALDILTMAELVCLAGEA